MLFSVRLPVGTNTVPYSDLPLLITEAKYGPSDALNENVLALFGADWVRAESELEKAVRRGEVELLDSSFYPLCPSFTRGRLERTVITMAALRCYLERINGALVVGEDEPPVPAVTQAAPVAEVPAVPGTATIWTDARKADARAYREKHGLKKTAEHYRVSQATISKHIPAGKPQKNPLGPWGGLVNK